MHLRPVGNIVTAASQTEAPATAESAMQTAKVHRRPKEAAEEDTTTAGVEAKKSPKKHRGGAPLAAFSLCFTILCHC